MPNTYSPNLEALSDLCTPWCLRAAVTLGIAEHIKTGIASLEELAEVSGSDPYYLRCVLRQMVSKGIFEEDKNGNFQNNAASLELTQEIWRVLLGLDGLGGRLAKAWGTLPEAVKTGKPQYEQLFGLPFWEDLDTNPGIRNDFESLMGPNGHGVPDPEILPSGDWKDFQTVVDVGGGDGELLVAILKKYGHLRGTLVDLPSVMKSAENKFRREELADRVSLAPGSFFNELPKGGDVYILKSILNDWGDEEALAILKRCREAMTAKSRLIVRGGVSADDQPNGMGPELVLVGGKVRTIEEFRGLSGEAGLRVNERMRPTFGTVVECRLG